MQISQNIDSNFQEQASKSRNSLRMLAGVAICLTMVGASVSAIAQEKLSDAQANYQKERANCLNGRTNEDRATCLKEAGAAFDAAKRGQLNNNGAQYQKNSMLRCQALEGENRQACELRMQGDGTTSGSVAAGGVLRELTIKEPASDQATKNDGDK
ncbi:MAG TPA: hypothetical protein VK832_00080 [Burkholderiaceae bacterium]|nr:hypothetical protein [Burkholderiaceae bacterium]